MKFEVKTGGHHDFIDLTARVAEAVGASGVRLGTATVFVSGSTAAVTTMEYEEGLKRDMKDMFERLAPEAGEYEHHKRWGDRNGAAHIKAAVVGPSVSVPVEDGQPALGEWQQIVLIDFDERPRQRQVTVNIWPCA